MLISESVRDLIHTQITKEFESANLYLGISSYFDVKALFGFAKFFKMHAEEELKHAYKFIEYLNDRNVRYIPNAINPHPIFTDNEENTPFINVAVENEIKVTESIYAIYEAAIESKDYISKEFLTWYLNEQKEEEKVFTDLQTRCKMIGKDYGAFLDIDRDLAKE